MGERRTPQAKVIVNPADAPKSVAIATPNRSNPLNFCFATLTFLLTLCHTEKTDKMPIGGIR
jgi:hypothetical protein